MSIRSTCWWPAEFLLPDPTDRHSPWIPPSPPASRPFRDWLREQAPKVGYDPSNDRLQRSGWMAAIARAAGMQESQISRAVAGRSMQMPGYRALAAALGTTTLEVLLRAGVLTAADLPEDRLPGPVEPVADTKAFASLRGIPIEHLDFYVQAVNAITDSFGRPEK